MALGMKSQREQDEQDHAAADPKSSAPKQDSHATTETAKEPATKDSPAATDDHTTDSHAKDSHNVEAHAADHGHAVATYLESDTFIQRLEKGKAWFLDPHHLFDHVKDADNFHVPKVLGEHWNLPKLSEKPMVEVAGVPIIRGQVTKFMVLELAAAVLIFVMFKWLATKIASGAKPTGRAWNFLEAIVVFIRDDIARPAIGDHDTKRFLPFLLTLFFFILTLNLFGMIPFLGSATGSIAVTAVFAVVTFLVVIGSGMKKMGVVGFWQAQLPHMDLPPALALTLKPSIWAIEVFGLFVKHFVLAVRLFANMFAGHLVLAVFIAFIGVVSATFLIWAVAPIAIVAAIALSVLELFVACLQAYVFTFLAALFIGAAQHAH